MPYDGISFSDSGFKVNLPSEIALQAEMSAQTHAKTIIKKPEESQKVKPDGERAKQDSQGKDSQEDEEDEFLDENSPEFINKSKKTKKFKVSFNQSNDMVELIDRKTGKIIETISPNELLNLISKSKTASGILVDRRI